MRYHYLIPIRYDETIHGRRFESRATHCLYANAMADAFRMSHKQNFTLKSTETEMASSFVHALCILIGHFNLYPGKFTLQTLDTYNICQKHNITSVLIWCDKIKYCFQWKI